MVTLLEISNPEPLNISADSSLMLVLARSLGGMIIAGILSSIVVFTGGTQLSGVVVSMVVIGAVLFRHYDIFRGAFDDRNLALVTKPITGSLSMTIRISKIVSVVEVLDLEDFGPGYIVTTHSRERVFIKGEQLYDVNGIEDVEDLLDFEASLPEEIVVRVRLPGMYLEHVVGFGRKVECKESVSTDSVGEIARQSFALLPQGFKLSPTSNP